MDHHRGAQADRRRDRRPAVGPRPGDVAGVDRFRSRRHCHGLCRGKDWCAMDRHFRRRDDLDGTCALHRRRDLAPLRRPGPVRRIFRHRGHERAVLRLCEPVVRSPPRLGARADFERQLSGRRDLAVDVRARHHLCRMASDDVLLWPARSRAGRSAGSDLPAPTARVGAAGGCVRNLAGSEDRDGLAAQSRIRPGGCRGHLLLHSHGHAAGPSARAVQRSRHPGVARRGHAVGALGHRLHQPSVLGLGFRPRRRAQHRVDRLVIPDHRDDRVHAHAG